MDPLQPQSQPQGQPRTDEADPTESIVVVRALYPYQSTDDSTISLAFESDDLIQVVSKLESGWWYGLCNGARGWFPSNFVEEIVQRDLDLESTLDSQDDSDSDDDTEANDDLWLPQTTADGQVFYFNTRTGDSSWSIPTPMLEEKHGHRSHNRTDSTSSAHPTPSEASSTAPTRDIDHDQTRSVDSRTIASAHGRADTDSRAGSSRPSSWQPSALPTRAGSPTSDGSRDSSNPTQDTALSGLRKPSGWTAPSSTPLADPAHILPPLPTVSNPFESKPTWTSISEHTTKVLENLVYSADHGYKPYYQVQAAQVVESIRLMLYASGTIDKDSTPIRMHHGLKVHHRQIMAALSRLVLSAKMAASVWSAEGSVAKMRADADDVAHSVHQFIVTAQSSNILVHDVDAKLILDPQSPFESKSARKLSRALSNASRTSIEELSDSHPYRRSLGSSGILTQLDYYSKSASKAITLLALQISQAIERAHATGPAPSLPRPASNSSILNSAQSTQLVAQCHQTISQLGSLLTLVSEFYTLIATEHPTIEDRYFLDVRVSKQTLYNNVAALVMVIQLATDPMAQVAALEATLEATSTAETAVQDLAAATRTLAMEKDEAEKMARASVRSESNATLVANSTYSGHQRQHDFDGYFNGMDSDMDNETARTSQFPSDSHVSSSNSSMSAISAPTTPGAEYMVKPPPLPTMPLKTADDMFAYETARVVHPDVRETARGAKLKKMLGEEAPAPKPKPKEQPWYLGHDYSQADIAFNMEGHVKGGTLPALVERLTLHDGLDSNFIATFLLTYRSFATTSQFFSLLFRRFTIQPPMGLDEDELEIWKEKKLAPIRFRVFNIIKSWLENYYLEDEEEDREILPKIKEFAESGLMRETMSLADVQLIKLVEKREASDKSFRKMVLNLTTQAPQPITPRNLKRIRFMDIDALEFARQLTIMEAGHYNKIKPIECLAKAWASEDPEMSAKAVNIKRMIETSNLYANWLNEIILSEKEVKKRAAVIKQIILIAERLRQLNNFSMLSSTMAALAHSPVHRLKRTWELLPSKIMNTFTQLQFVTGSAKNWSELRSELHRANPPCVPFVGLYLTDLVFIQDGNHDFSRAAEHQINFYKRVKTAEVIREIQQYQLVPYCLTTVPEMQAYIRRGLDHAKSVAQLHELSLELEPREGEEDKITRLLSESGFL